MNRITGEGLLLLGSAAWCRMRLYMDASPEQ